MAKVRIIPCLDFKDGRVVKGVHFVELKDAGDPPELAARYEKEGADELAFLDITATVEGRKTMLSWVKKVTQVITIPLTVGGGIGSLTDMEETFAAGASKVSINTAAVKNPQLVKQAKEKFGKERIMVAIDAKKTQNSKLKTQKWEVYIYGGRKPAGIDVLEWAKEVEKLGAGEILPTSIETDGTQVGYDVELIRAIVEATSLAVIASGGAGTLDDFYQAAKAGATGLLAASVFHFGQFTPHQVKKYLRERGI